MKIDNIQKTLNYNIGLRETALSLSLSAPKADASFLHAIFLKENVVFVDIAYQKTGKTNKNKSNCHLAV